MTTVEQRKSLPRENLCRSVSFELVRADDTANGDGLTFTGYGAVFNSPTRIDSWEGQFDEQIAPGAFRKSLRERTPKFQFDHGRHPLIGSIPIGVISDIHEDERGLFVEARLGQHIIIDLVREAIATGAIDGMSFRFDVVNDEWRDVNGKVVKPDDVRRILYYGEQPERAPLVRTLKEVKISEVGPVVWPAYADTSASMRSAGDKVVEIDTARLNEPEQRKQLAELLLRADAAAAPEEGDSSDDEPQDTPGGAVEHSGEDTDADTDTGAAGDAPQATDNESAGEHESNSDRSAPTDAVDAARAAAVDRLFQGAFDLVKNTRDATPPPTNL